MLGLKKINLTVFIKNASALISYVMSSLCHCLAKSHERNGSFTSCTRNKKKKLDCNALFDNLADIFAK